MEKQSFITVQVVVKTNLQNAWKLWTTPADIQQWNVPFASWHTTLVENDLKAGGRFNFKMQAKDNSAGFDFTGAYDEVVLHQKIAYTLDDGRRAYNTFTANGNETILTENFEPEDSLPAEKQKEFCLAVLNKFKAYAEQKITG